MKAGKNKQWLLYSVFIIFFIISMATEHTIAVSFTSNDISSQHRISPAALSLKQSKPNPNYSTKEAIGGNTANKPFLVDRQAIPDWQEDCSSLENWTQCQGDPDFESEYEVGGDLLNFDIVTATGAFMPSSGWFESNVHEYGEYAGVFRSISGLRTMVNWQLNTRISYDPRVSSGGYSHKGQVEIQIRNQDKQLMLSVLIYDPLSAPLRNELKRMVRYYDSAGAPHDALASATSNTYDINDGILQIKNEAGSISVWFPKGLPNGGDWLYVDSATTLLQRGTASYLTLLWHKEYCTSDDQQFNEIGFTSDWYLFDREPPQIDHPDDISYEENSTGNTITWEPTDSNPYRYTVYQNESEIASDSWNGAAITINIDNLSTGAYNFTMVVYDLQERASSDSILVEVVSASPPVIEQPDDICYEENTGNYTIIWEPSDLSPANYTLYRDGSVIDSGEWLGEKLSFTLENLSPGVYNYSIIVFDTIGYWTASTVLVTVIPAGSPDICPPIIDHPEDVTYVEGTLDNVIYWWPRDAHPANSRLYRNGTLIQSRSWGGEIIYANIDGLSAGVYNYTLVVVDELGNKSWDTIFVYVLPAPTLTTSLNESQSSKGTGADNDSPGFEAFLALLSLFIGFFGLQWAKKRK